ncbi:MAG: hypothetical protein WC701_02790 [Kiritimatiellales bacterium]|jgi:predicted NBD/HSP70 family sugar kinase
MRMVSKFAEKTVPAIPAPLDPGFCPAILFERALFRKLEKTERLVIAAERENGCISRRELTVARSDSALCEATLLYVERVVKFMLWASGGWKLYIGGPEWIGRRIAGIYSASGLRAFDAALMERVYQKPFETVICDAEAVPDAKENEMTVGGHLDGCRIGFDLGASDYKLSAVKDGETVFTVEIPWDPVKQANPDYHSNAIRSGLKLAAEHLPRVDAIGGSSAGIFVDDCPMVASLFRSVPLDQYAARIKPLFRRLRDEWGVPLTVINDGDVTALAGAMSLKKRGMLGIAMGSSEAAGFLNRKGCVTGQLNELAFAPVDFNPNAAADEWSGDTGVGSLYFSQQAVNKLAPAAGFRFPAEMRLPERLKAVQDKADAGDENALKIFETIGVYLGYTLPWYAQFYDYEHVLILGRVTSGRGGGKVPETARRVLETEFPEFAAKVQIHVPDEKSRRVGQAVAAASLPLILR